MRRNSTASQQILPNFESLRIDMRPESSPYASPLITLHFADGPPLAVPTRLIDKCPKLSSCCGYDMTLHLAHIPSGAGHVLVHYLFTGIYECLKPRGSSHYEKDAAEFATAVRVYAVARDYGLPDLESLARREIEKLGNCLQVMQILDMLQDILPTPSADDMWLQNYLKSLVRPFIDNPPASRGSLSDSSGQTLSMANALLKVVIELWREKMYSLSSSPNDLGVSQDHRDKPAAAHVEAGPAINLEHNPTNVLESTHDHEDVDAASKKAKKGKKKKREAGNGIGVHWDVAIEEQRPGVESKEQAEVQGEGGDIASVAFIATGIISTSEQEVSLNAKARRRLKRAQQNSTADNHTQSEPKPMPKENDLEPIPRPLSLFGGSFGSS